MTIQDNKPATVPDRLYVDLDDVIGETARRLLVMAEQEYGLEVPFEAVTSFDLDVVFGMDAEETAQFYRRSNQADVLSGVALREGAVESLAACRSGGIEVWVVTDRPSADNVEIPPKAPAKYDPCAAARGGQHSQTKTPAARSLLFKPSFSGKGDPPAILQESSLMVRGGRCLRYAGLVND